MFLACQTESHLESVEKTDFDLELKNGVLHYKNNPFNGFLVSYYPNRCLKSKVPYAKGRKEGIEKHWFENGLLALERPYSKGLKKGIHRAWWIDGILKFEYHFDDKGAYHGLVREWYASGQLFREFNYENGVEKGNQRLWKLNGNIKANYSVYQGDRFGLIGLKKCETVRESTNKT
jgi:antitoxin component YwqK of YwqJK toxin-antitoxin module